MKFNEAFEMMKKGRKIRRPFWVDDRYWFIKNFSLWSSFAGGTKVLSTSYEPITLLEMCACEDWQCQNDAGEWVFEIVPAPVVKPEGTVTVADLKNQPCSPAMQPVFWDHDCQCGLCGVEIKEELYHAKVWCGAWAVLCKNCFSTQGGRLGVNLGQRYEKKGEKFQMAEG